MKIIRTDSGGASGIRFGPDIIAACDLRKKFVCDFHKEFFELSQPKKLSTAIRCFQAVLVQPQDMSTSMLTGHATPASSPWIGIRGPHHDLVAGTRGLEAPGPSRPQGCFHERCLVTRHISLYIVHIR